MVARVDCNVNSRDSLGMLADFMAVRLSLAAHEVWSASVSATVISCPVLFNFNYQPNLKTKPMLARKLSSHLPATRVGR